MRPILLRVRNGEIHRLCRQGKTADYCAGFYRVQLQFKRPGDFETFPLSAGDGNYQIAVLEHACDDLYAIAFSQDIEVTISDEFKPFLYPNQYVWYTPDSEAVAFGAEISDKSSNDLDYVEQVYRYVIENITYDDALAANVRQTISLSLTIH